MGKFWKNVGKGLSTFYNDFTWGEGSWGDNLVGDITGRNAADNAVDAQKDALAASMGIQREALDQQMEMFNRQQEMLSPFVDQAEGAMGQMGAITGTEGAEAQQAAYGAIQNSPMFQSQVQQGENALLQNAAATGGVRGGNMQAALSQFRPQMLQNSINQQYDQLGGIASLGMGPLSQAASGFGSMADAQGQFGSNAANLTTQSGQAEAANYLGQYQMGRDFIFDLAGLGVNIAGLF